MMYIHVLYKYGMRKSKELAYPLPHIFITACSEDIYNFLLAILKSTAIL